MFVTLVMVGLGNIGYWVAPAEYGTAVIGPAGVRQRKKLHKVSLNLT